MIQAVLCGNSVVVKPSEVTPMSGALVEEIFALAEAPVHLVQTVIGDGETGAELIDHGPDKVSFTGSVATGKKIATKCGEMLIPYSLELGGKDAMIVCSDADVKDAASGAVVGSCMNAGQYCCGTERIYVMDDIYDEFVGEVVSITKTLIQSNDSIAGCSVHLVTPELDGGPILAQSEVLIKKNETEKSLASKVLLEEHVLYPKVLLNFSNQNIGTSIRFFKNLRVLEGLFESNYCRDESAVFDKLQEFEAVKATSIANGLLASYR